jgi:hypothetical protein
VLPPLAPARQAGKHAVVTRVRNWRTTGAWECAGETAGGSPLGRYSREQNPRDSAI